MSDDDLAELVDGAIASVDPESNDLGPVVTLDAFEEADAEYTNVDQFLAVVKKIAETEGRVDAAAADDRHMKWRVVDDGMYTAVGHTTTVMPPGVYDIVVDQRGTVYWQEIEPRTDDIIRFPNAPIDEVVGEIERFWSREAKFKQYGLPFKRGILLWGPPGSGKSCTLQMVAREMVKLGGYVVQFNSVEHFVSAYRILRSVQPESKLIVLMEDLDEILKGKSSSGESRILNLLDGIESTHKVVFLATTNYPRELGPRISNRPSRFDHKVHVSHPKTEDRRTYLQSLIRSDDDETVNVEQYVRDTEGLSLAHVKELFVAAHILGENYADCAARLKTMSEKESSVDDGDEFKAPEGWYR
jgi:hypothetical protein